MAKKSASGRFLLRVPPALHLALRRGARAEGTSLNSYCRDALQAAVDVAAGDAAVAAAVDAAGDATTHGCSEASAWQRAATAIVREVGVGLEAVVLFGSRARGYDGPDSDVDLLLAVAPGESMGRERYAAWDQGLAGAPEIRALGARVSPHFARLPTESPGRASGGGALWLEAALHGIVLWQRTDAPSRWIGDAREMMAAGALSRRLAHGQPYWVAGGAVAGGAE